MTSEKVLKIYNRIKKIAHEQNSMPLQSLYNHIEIHNKFIEESFENGFDEDWIIIQLVKYGSWEVTNKKLEEFVNAKDFD